MIQVAPNVGRPLVLLTIYTVGSLADPTYVDTGLGSMSTGGVAAPSTTSAGGVTGGRDAMTCEMTVTSSPGGSSGNDEPARRAVEWDRKRKGREAEESECQSEVSMQSFSRIPLLSGRFSTIWRLLTCAAWVTWVNLRTAPASNHISTPHFHRCCTHCVFKSKFNNKNTLCEIVFITTEYVN